MAKLNPARLDKTESDGTKGVGRVMAALGNAHAHTSNDPGSDSRVAIRHFIEQSPTPVRIESISTHTGLHNNTIRPHLDSLMASGAITRERDQDTGRGRPHWLYSTTTSDVLADLARALDEELQHASQQHADPEQVVRKVAAEWMHGGEPISPAASDDEAVDQATTLLGALGFEADRNVVGDEITLRSCPYAALVRDHPAICDIHGALLEEILLRSGRDIALDQLEVFRRPGVCVARLNRADTKPEWVVMTPTSKRQADK